uniref:Transmembrane emp24 domain-containing protein 10 n=2 Tax=Schistocephalus solidus TaxID=70667 RepID=A0A0X3NYE7_SCHSO
MHITVLIAVYFPFLLVLSPSAEAIRFYLQSGTVKCLHDEMEKDVMVIGEYDVSAGATSHVNIEVKDTKGHIFFQKSDITKGKFTFSAEDDETFDVCFRCTAAVGTHEQREIYLDIKQGVETKNYAALAEAENLKPIEAELKRIEYISDSIVKDFVSMHSRADAMRNINASTHSRVLYFSVFSMLCLVALATWQVLYLRRYFKSKKLID